MRKPISLILAIILLIACSGCFWGWGHDEGGYEDGGRGGYGEQDHRGHDDHDRGGHDEQDRGGYGGQQERH